MCTLHRCASLFESTIDFGYTQAFTPPEDYNITLFVRQLQYNFYTKDNHRIPNNVRYPKQKVNRHPSQLCCTFFCSLFCSRCLFFTLNEFNCIANYYQRIEYMDGMDEWKRNGAFLVQFNDLSNNMIVK